MSQENPIIFTTEEPPDCVFVIEDKEINAHKLKLTSKSPVFEKMFFGKMASSRINITDIASEDFCQMLDYIYNDNVKIESVLQAWALFYAAHKYLLNDFANVCLAYILDNITISTLILNYEYAEVYDIKDVKKICMDIVSDYVRGVFHEQCGYHMKPSSILAILKQSNLNINNNELVKGVLNWAVTECFMQKLDLTVDNVLNLLVSFNILSHLVNLSFTIDDKSDNLILECCKQIKNHKKANTPYIITVFNSKHWCTFCKCRITYKIAARMMLKAKNHLYSSLSVSKDTFLYGLVVATEDRQSGINGNNYKGSIEIEISQLNVPNSIVKTVISKELSYESFIYVPLSELVYLECDKVYCIKIGYRNFSEGIKCSSILRNYMNNKLYDEKKNTIFSIDELDGGVIKGLCYYPV